MEPLDYESTDASRARVPPEHIEEAFGCFPAVLSIVVGSVGFAAAVWARSVHSTWAVATAGMVAVGMVIGSWGATVSCLRHPRGTPAGIVSLLGVMALTVVVGCVLIAGR